MQTALTKTWQNILRENCRGGSDLLRMFGVEKEPIYANSISKVINSIYPSPKAIEAEAVKMGIAQKGWARLFFRGMLKVVLMVKGFPVSDGHSLIDDFADSFCASYGGSYKISVFLMFFARIKAGAVGRSFGRTDPTQVGEAFAKDFLPWYNTQIGIAGRQGEQQDEKQSDTACTMEVAEQRLGMRFNNIRRVLRIP